MIATGPCIGNQLRDASTICRRSWYIAAHVWKIYDFKIEVFPFIINFSTELTTVVKFVQIQRMLILAKSRTWVRATKPISSVDVSRHLQVPQVGCHHSVHYICPCVLSSNMFGSHDKIDELDVKHRQPSVLTINIIQGIIGSIKPCFFWCCSTRSEQRAVLCLC